MQKALNLFQIIDIMVLLFSFCLYYCQKKISIEKKNIINSIQFSFLALIIAK